MSERAVWSVEHGAASDSPRPTLHAARCLNCGTAQILALRIGLLREMVAGFFTGYYRSGATPTVAQGAVVDFTARYFVSLGALAVAFLTALCLTVLLATVFGALGHRA